jgi:L-ascorbate metabolism protein UlaG (beta-lactamase superfamily)
MIITYLGKQFFKVAQGDTVLAFNPIGKGSKAGSVSRFGADVALTTTNHPDFNGVENLSHGDTVPFVISGPGDYETKGIFIRGFMTKTTLDKKEYINTVYSLTFDGINLCFLGALSDEKITADVREAIGAPDILFVPIGGEEVLAAAPAYKLAVSLEPKLIIPMDYDAASLKTFLKEAGEDKVEPIEKLTIKKKDLEGKDAEVVILQS